MNWIEIITKSLEFIEKNLESNKLSAESVAKNVNISYGHFSRAFNILTGFTVSEYIRNRRLSVAGYLLKNTNKSVLDVSLDVGYESPEAFSKAFKRFHNANPNESKNASLKDFFPLQVQLSLTQEPHITPTIEVKSEIILNGNIQVVPDDDISTAALWQVSEVNGDLDSLYSSKGFKNIVGVYQNNNYTIKSLSSCKSSNCIVIEPHKWAVFNCVGTLPDSINQTWNKIYSSWLSNNDIEISDLPQLEIYKEDLYGYSCEIWIPI